MFKGKKKAKVQEQPKPKAALNQLRKASGLCTGCWLKETGAERYSCVLNSPINEKAGIVIRDPENRLNCIKGVLFLYDFPS